MKIATYNVNSINARIENLSKWLKRENPDVVMVQEIKCEYDNFPFLELQSLGYNAAILGQKSYNGVAILSPHKIKVIQEGLPNFTDEQSRYLEAEIEAYGQKWRVASIYLPNGNPPYNNANDDSRYDYKLNWMDSLINHAQELVNLQQPVILGGDFNVILTDNDVYNPQKFEHDALFRPEVRHKLKALQYSGFYDAYRTLHPHDSGYSYWDYGGGAVTNDDGLRIDYLWMSAKAVDRLISCDVDKSPRLDNKPSDHTVLKAELN